MAGRRAVLAGMATAAAAQGTASRARAGPGVVSARTVIGEFRRGEFDMVGVFDADWLPEPRMARMLDAMAASPGAFGAVRFFGLLNAGEREQTFPTGSGSTWPAPEAPMDFSPSFAALDALVSRGLIPFIALTFFPAAVSPSPIAPPDGFARWQALLRGFLDAAVARFGADEVARWWLEVWNEPNMPPFWRGDFDRYLDLYRATAHAVRESGHRLRLGGPAIAWMPPEEGSRLMRRFLAFLRDAPDMPCDFLSYHRKGIWVNEETEPRLSRLVQAAEETAQMARELVPERCRGLVLVNNEADMKVGFDHPYAPRMDERFPSWLAAAAIGHTALSLRHAGAGLRFMAAADNANQHLVRAPFDGRRALFTRTDAGPADLIRLPVFQFYELLRLLGDRLLAIEPGPEIFQVTTAGEGRIAALVTLHPEGPGGPRRLRWTIADLPWPRVNLAVFRIDGTHSNAFAAAGRRMPARVDAAAARRLRVAAELAAQPPLRSGLVPEEGGRLSLDLVLDPFATLLVWVTPFDPAPPARPAGLRAEPRGADVLLRWEASRAPELFGYEVLRHDPGRPWRVVAPVLRGAEWTDTAPPSGALEYRLRALSTSGRRSPAAAVALRR
jgi:xylan 1,4-beta-xylosidase